MGVIRPVEYVKSGRGVDEVASLTFLYMRHILRGVTNRGKELIEVVVACFGMRGRLRAPCRLVSFF